MTKTQVIFYIAHLIQLGEQFLLDFNIHSLKMKKAIILREIG